MEFYTDGSYKSSISRGGYAVVGVEDNTVKFKFQKFEDNTTNNRMELKAILYTLYNFGSIDNPPIVYSDSAYCVNTFTTWKENWKKNNWLKNDGKEPLNIDLIKAYDRFIEITHKTIDLRWVKGHAANDYNNLADKLATGQIML